MEKITTLIVRGNGWTIKRTGIHKIIINFLDLLIDIAVANGDVVIIVDEINTDSIHEIIINYERR